MGAQLSTHGDPLEALNATIRWTTFRPVLQKLQRRERKRNARPYDVMVMFTLLVLQSLYNRSDAPVIDATIVPAPRQGNSREETQLINAGEIPPDWQHQP